MNRTRLVPLVLIVLAGLAACGTLFVAPQSFSEKLAAGYLAHTAVVTATTNALNAGDISSADAEHVAKIAAEARSVLDAAKLANDAGDVKTAQGRLSMALSVIAELQTYIRGKS